MALSKIKQHLKLAVKNQCSFFSVQQPLLAKYTQPHAST